MKKIKKTPESLQAFSYLLLVLSLVSHTNVLTQDKDRFPYKYNQISCQKTSHFSVFNQASFVIGLFSIKLDNMICVFTSP